MLAAVGETPTVAAEFDSPPGATTVQVVRANNTVVATGTATVSGSVASFQLPPAATTQVDQLAVIFTAADGRTRTELVDVAGGWLCSLADIDTILARGGSAASYPEAAKRAARAAAQELIEQACGVRFTPRYTRVTVSGEGGTLLDTRMLLVRRVLSARDAAGTPVDVTAVTPVGDGGVVTNPAGWPVGAVTLELEYGLSAPPADVARACAVLASAWLADGPWDDRGFAVADDLGAMRLVTAGIGGAATSIPEVESVIRRYRHVPVP